MTEKTKPWCQIDVEWWPAIAEALPHPWPTEAVQMDLRWWADQEGMGRAKRPGRPALRARWGWPDRRTRNAMKDAPERQKSSPRPARVQPASSQGPETDMQTPDIIRPRVQPGSSPRPARVQPASPRAELQTNTHTQQTTENKTRTSDSLTAIRQLWDELNGLRKSLDSAARPLKLTASRQRALKARLKEHSAAEVVAVVDWWLRSAHQRAQYLRDNGYGIDTVLRPANFTTYLELSKMPLPRPKAASFSVPPPAPRRAIELPALSLYSEGQVEAVKADLEGLHDTCQPETWDRMVRTALAQSFGRAAK
jgi:hypothetical protein